MREYKKLDGVKEFVNEKDGVICLKIENLYKSINNWIDPSLISKEGNSGRKSSPNKIIMKIKSSNKRSISWDWIQSCFKGVKSARRYSRSIPTWRICHWLYIINNNNTIYLRNSSIFNFFCIVHSDHGSMMWCTVME